MSEDYRGRRVLVLGLSRSGIAAARLLTTKGAVVLANDRRPLAELDDQARGLDAELVTGSHPSSLARKADWVVASPGVPPDNPIVAEALARGIPIWSELELGYRHAKGSIIAVTGTKGKSTTATLIRDIVSLSGRRVKLVGNIGTPFCAEVDDSTTDTIFVVEASSFQLQYIDRFRPDIAVLLDVSPDHLDWHPSFDDYVAAKARIFENQTADDTAVVFGGNQLTVTMASRNKSRKVFFSLDCLPDRVPHFHADGTWIVRHADDEKDPFASFDRFPLPGRHNRENAMAASAAAFLVGASGDDAEAAFEQFEGLPHALEKVADIAGVRYYNDSRATNIQAVRAAVSSFETPILLILGGRFKGGDFRELRDVVQRHVKRAFAIGESKDLIAAALDGAAPLETCRDLDEAVGKAHAQALSGDVVLLSPAGSSFDMFRDYQERGERFRALVSGLSGEQE